MVGKTPLVMTFTLCEVENGHSNDVSLSIKNLVIFHSSISLPEDSDDFTMKIKKSRERTGHKKIVARFQQFQQLQQQLPNRLFTSVYR